MVKFGWDKLKRFLAQANTWSGTQTFANAVIQAGSVAASVVVDLVTELLSPPIIGKTLPKEVWASPSASKGPAIINSGFAGTVSTSGSSTTVTFSSAADAILAGYNATNPVLGTTLISNALTRYIVSWTNATTCVVDSAVTLSAAAITSVQLPIATYVNSAGVTQGWMNAAGNVWFITNLVKQFGVGDSSVQYDLYSNTTSGADRNWRIVNGSSLRGALEFMTSTAYGGTPNTTSRFIIDVSGNILTGGLTAAGTSAAKVLAIGEGTAPSDSPANAVQLWSADVGGVALKNGLHMRDEAGNSGPVAFAKTPEYTVAATINPVTSEKLYGGQWNNIGQDADAVITLPAAVLGMNFTVILGTTVAQYYRIDPEASDSIYLDGVTTGDGKYVGVASAAIGNAIQFTTFTGASGVAWFATTVSGAWLAEA